MQNTLYVGFDRTISLPHGGFLFIHDELPKRPLFATVFDPLEHTLNPLKGIEYKAARDLSDVLYTAYPQGENTLTVRNGRRALLQALLTTTRLDRIKGDEEVEGMIQDILTSPVLRKVLCSRAPNFSFKKETPIFARINRAELGDFDALVLGLILIGHYKGQIILPDAAFYLRDAHIALVREERLIAGVHYLDELKPRAPALRQAILLIEDKVPSRTLLSDAQLLAEYAGKVPGTNGFNDFVEASVGL